MNKHKMEEYLYKYMHVYKDDMHSRYRSFDYAHKVFCSNFGQTNADTLDYVAMHLFVFLGSWGMLCRRDCLLRKDYKFLISLVEKLYNKKYAVLIDANPCDASFNRAAYATALLDVIEKIKEHFNSATYYEIDDFMGHRCKASDTLIGKILLATFACLPAYDFYMSKGLRAEDIYAKINKKGIASLLDYCDAYKVNLLNLQDDVKIKYGVTYPIMKIVDMIFFEYGVICESHDKHV